MKTLYQAASAIEAHMICDVLRQEGIDAQVLGEHLQGAMGELPAAGLVRVMVVDEADYDRGREVVERWDAAQPAEEPAPSAAAAAARAGKKKSWGVFLLGLGLGCAATAAYFRAPVSMDGVDHNRDGVLDEKWVYAASGRMVRAEVDRNLDGKVDHVSHFDPPGVLKAIEADDDFDGVFETHSQVRAGNADVSDVDTDGDGYPDLRFRFSAGVVATLEFIDPASGLPLRVEHFRLGRLTSAEVDSDRDGVLDRRLRYTALGEVAASERLLAP